MEKVWSVRLIRLAAVFGLLGAIVGSDMSGSGNYQLRAIHAHMLVVGWLSVFAWGLFYKVYEVKVKKLVSLHGWTAAVGSVGLTAGMLLYNVNPFNFNEVFTLIAFIVGGTVLLISFVVFILISFLLEKEDSL
ncbi:hypothetical protein [Bacillus thermotolerans]|uniref:Cytochrome-c oxidase n=1 Tax=Bacillus thermotolerans TaxID=1221996 RepID=A0A0F5HM56_BACTR|nr:hypothetical protein [Bacillus thermotolerans]KKB33922.1 hypothetical protein QY97_02885 [Bacillus thermotolerans]KKB35683.1 hypothetical protein QY95_03341 [Bacillus thermotolerans]KKB37497.1 hypothetical protein QY96_03170 [Bacillus thermotolerans]